MNTILVSMNSPEGAALYSRASGLGLQHANCVRRPLPALLPGAPHLGAQHLERPVVLVEQRVVQRRQRHVQRAQLLQLQCAEHHQSQQSKIVWIQMLNIACKSKLVCACLCARSRISHLNRNNIFPFCSAGFCAVHCWSILFNNTTKGRTSCSSS